MTRLDLTEQQLQSLAGLLGIATQAIGANLAQHGLRALDDAERKLRDAIELRDIAEAALQPKPKTARKPKEPK